MAVGPTIRGDLNVAVVQAMDAHKMFIGRHVAPIFGVDLRSGQYPVFEIGGGQLLSLLDDKRQQNGAYNEVQRQYKLADYTCEDRGLEERIDDANRKDVARFFNDEVRAANMTGFNILLNYESRVATLAQNPSNFTAVSAASPYIEANLGTIDFAADILGRIDYLEGFGVIPDTIVIPAQIASMIGRTTKFQNYVKPFNAVTGANLGAMVIGTAALQSVFAERGIEKVLIGRSSANTQKNSGTPSLTRLWKPDYIWVGRTGDTSQTIADMQDAGVGFGQDYYDELGGAMRTLVWNEDGGYINTETYRDEKRRSDMARVRQHAIEKVIDKTKGALIQTSFA